MDRVLLHQANVVVDVRACCYLSKFDVGAMNNIVTYTANASLTAFNPSELPHKGLAIRVAISGLGQTMFEFTLEGSI